MQFTKLRRKLVIIKFIIKPVIIWSYETLLFSIHRICSLSDDSEVDAMRNLYKKEKRQ